MKSKSLKEVHKKRWFFLIWRIMLWYKFTTHYRLNHMQVIMNLYKYAYYILRLSRIYPTFPHMIPRDLQGFVYDSQVITITITHYKSPRKPSQIIINYSQIILNCLQISIHSSETTENYSWIMNHYELLTHHCESLQSLQIILNHLFYLSIFILSVDS